MTQAALADFNAAIGLDPSDALAYDNHADIRCMLEELRQTRAPLPISMSC